LLGQLRFKLILAFQVIQILPHIAIYLRYFAKLLARDAAGIIRVGLDKAPVHGEVFSLHQTTYDASFDDLLKQLFEEL
jgi:hypothetical protein